MLDMITQIRIPNMKAEDINVNNGRVIQDYFIDIMRSTVICYLNDPHVMVLVES